MRLAIVLGSGPEVDLIYRDRRLLPKGSAVYVANTSEYAAIPDGGFPVMDVFNWRAVRESLNKSAASNSVLIGSLQPKNPRLIGKKNSLYMWAIMRHYMLREDISDAVRESFARRHRNRLEFPPLKAVLPILFAEDEIRVNPDDALLRATLRHPSSIKRDFITKIDSKLIKIFRVRAGATHLINRRLMQRKFEDSYTKESITHFFFQRDRTVVLDLKKMTEYAITHGLTLQSFD